MKLQFEKNQQHQIEAIESISALFQEQEKVVDKPIPEELIAGEGIISFENFDKMHFDIVEGLPQYFEKSDPLE